MPLGVVLAASVVVTELSYSAQTRGVVPQETLALPQEAEALVGAFFLRESSQGALCSRFLGTFSFSEYFHGASRCGFVAAVGAWVDSGCRHR